MVDVTPAARPADEFLPGLHALRGLAALWVVGLHLGGTVTDLPAATDVAGRLLARAPLAVELFFIMSGFIIARRYALSLATAGWAGYRDFLVRRVARIYPLHLLSLALFLAMLAVAVGSGMTRRDFDQLAPWPEILRHLLLVQAWGREGQSFNAPAWSISVEWLLYLLFPLLLWPFRHGGAALVWLLLLCALRLWSEADLRREATPTALQWLPLVRGSIGFGCGLALERLLRRPLAANLVRAGWLCGAAVPAALLLTSWDWPAFLLFLPLTAAATGDLPGLPRRWARWMGDLSYPLYMTHSLAITAGGAALGHVAGWLAIADDAGLRVTLLVVTTLVAAWAAHRWVEQPARRWIIRRLDSQAGRA